MDFSTALSDMIKKDNAEALKYLIDPLFKLNIKKTYYNGIRYFYKEIWKSTFKNHKAIFYV